MLFLLGVVAFVAAAATSVVFDYANKKLNANYRADSRKYSASDIMMFQHHSENKKERYPTVFYLKINPLQKNERDALSCERRLFPCSKCVNVVKQNIFLFQCLHFICSWCLYKDVAKALEKYPLIFCPECNVPYFITKKVHDSETIEIRRLLTIEEFSSDIHSRSTPISFLCDVCECKKETGRISFCNHKICEECIYEVFDSCDIGVSYPKCPICRTVLNTKAKTKGYREITVNFNCKLQKRQTFYLKEKAENDNIKEANTSKNIDYICSKCKIHRNKNQFIYPCKHSLCSSCLFSYLNQSSKTILCPECKIPYYVEKPLFDREGETVRIRRKFTIENFNSHTYSDRVPNEFICNGCHRNFDGNEGRRSHRCGCRICNNCIEKAFASPEFCFQDPGCPICGKNLKSDSEADKYTELAVHFKSDEVEEEEEINNKYMD